MGRVLWWAALGVVVTILADGCSPASCVDRSECSSGEVCAYEVGSCSAQGHCMSRQGNSYLIEEFCGCDGTMVYGGPGVGFPDGYASGPTRGADVELSACETASPDIDSGDDAFMLPPFDAGTSTWSPDVRTMQDAAEAGEAAGDAEMMPVVPGDAASSTSDAVAGGDAPSGG